MTRRLVGLLLLSLATACGSTVQVSSTSAGSAQAGIGSPATELGPDQQGGSPASPVTGGTAGNGPVRLPTGSASGPASVPRGTTTGPVAGGPAASGALMRGVTRTTITVGVLAADPQANQTLKDAGFGAAALGDEPASWRAMADEVNARGGIAGRRLVLVFHLVNLTDPAAAQGQKACARFADDAKVAVVVGGYYYASAHTCLAKRGIPSLLGTNYGVDATESRQSATVIAWATPLLDRLAAGVPAAFQGMGKLRRGTSVGVFAVDAPAYRRSSDLLAAELRRRGLTVTTQTVRDSMGGDYGGAAGDASSAVLRFRSAGVTEVLFLSRNAFEPALFMQAASSQTYTPTYLLSTQQYPASLTGLVPARQLEGAVAMGWAPAVDLASGYDSSAAAKACLATMKRRGISYASGTEALVGLLVCDGLDLLRRTSALPGALASARSFLSAAVDPATGFVSAVTISTSFPGGRPDGVTGYRPMRFDGGCTCFRYTGGVATL